MCHPYILTASVAGDWVTWGKTKPKYPMTPDYVGAYGGQFPDRLGHKDQGGALILQIDGVSMDCIPRIETRPRYARTPDCKEAYEGRFLDKLDLEGQGTALFLLIAGAAEDWVPWVETRLKQLGLLSVRRPTEVDIRIGSIRCGRAQP